MKKGKPTYEECEAFKKDILEVCKRHGLYLEYYVIEYEEFDTDSGFNIVYITHETDLCQINSAVGSE